MTTTPPALSDDLLGADFYRYEALLPDEERKILHKARAFLRDDAMLFAGLVKKKDIGDPSTSFRRLGSLSSLRMTLFFRALRAFLPCAY